MQFTLTIQQGNNGFLVGTIKEIPSVMSQGKDENELKENIIDALNLYFEDMRDEYVTDKKSFIKEEPLVYS